MKRIRKKSHIFRSREIRIRVNRFCQTEGVETLMLPTTTFKGPLSSSPARMRLIARQYLAELEYWLIELVLVITLEK